MGRFQNLTSSPATLRSSLRLIVVQKSNRHFKFTPTSSDTPARKHEILFSPALSLLLLLFLPTITLTNTQNLIQSMRGPALLSGLHQETECERAARHHTEALLKIHVHHSSSFIDGLSSLYVYEGRGLPVAPNSDPEDPRKCLLPLIELNHNGDSTVDIVHKLHGGVR